MGGRVVARGSAALVALGVAVALAAPAHAAFPGQNGKIAYSAFDGDDVELFVMNQDGSAPVQLTDNTADDRSPAWSPDGKRIAFESERDDPFLPDCREFLTGCNYEIYVMNADGTAQTRITTHSARDWGPAWTPDGTRITFTRTEDCGAFGCVYRLLTAQADGSGIASQPYAGPGVPSEPAWAPNGERLMNLSYDFDWPGGALYTGNPDGTGDTFFCCTPLPEGGDNPPPGSPDWSPDGSAVAFDYRSNIARQNTDGTGFQYLTSGQPSPTENAPAWSPDGTKIVFRSDTSPAGIWVMEADGSNPEFLRSGSSPDWQPIPINAYPRPKSAWPQRLSLVPAYEPCTAPNRTHSAPLAFDSCHPPAQTSKQLTLGTPDANGRPAKSVSFVRVGVTRGDPATAADEADIRLRAEITDVRLASDLSDFTGELELRLPIQITDKDNTPHPGGPGPATVQELTHAQPVPCSATDDGTVGSTCQLTTTVEALVPGAVKELKRAIWELDQVAVHDGAGDPFMRQGVFIP